MKKKKKMMQEVTNNKMKMNPQLRKRKEDYPGKLCNDSSYSYSVTNFIASAGDKIREQKDSLVEKATTSFSQLDSKLRDMLKEYSFKINKWARYKIMEFVLMFIEK